MDKEELIQRGKELVERFKHGGHANQKVHGNRYGQSANLTLERARSLRKSGDLQKYIDKSRSLSGTKPSKVRQEEKPKWNGDVSENDTKILKESPTNGRNFTYRSDKYSVQLQKPNEKGERDIVISQRSNSGRPTGVFGTVGNININNGKLTITDSSILGMPSPGLSKRQNSKLPTLEEWNAGLGKDGVMEALTAILERDR